MSAGEPGPILDFQEPAAAPTCRSCLRSIDRLFPDAEPDPRLATVVREAVRVTLRYGTVEVFGVPGPQQPKLRSAARRELKAAGLDAGTFVHDTKVGIWSEEARRQAPADARAEMDDRLSATVAAIGICDTDRPDLGPPAWHLRWSDFVAEP